MNEEIKNKLITIDRDSIVCEIGSGTLPYIHTPRDVDVLVVCMDEDKYDNYCSKMGERKQDGVDIHPCLISTYLRHYLWYYLYHFAKPLQNELPNTDLFTTESIQGVLQEAEKILSEPYNYLYKVYYHLYSSLAFIKNRSYTLSMDDVSIINRFHDRTSTIEDFQQLLQLYDYVSHIAQS